MDRRRFVRDATLSLLATSAPLSLRAAADARLSSCDYFFFDERFPQARRLANELAAPVVSAPVWGDITAIWNAELGAAARESPLMLRGVTTESFFFCLNVMLRDQVSVVDTHVARIDADLKLWTLRTQNHNKRRATSWQTNFLPA